MSSLIVDTLGCAPSKIDKKVDPVYGVEAIMISFDINKFHQNCGRTNDRLCVAH